ncbi:hypothetical protein QJS04_geneDACA000544 [Acorus gramineus]|uniref:Uncharacterized protein n=1 Tax=Acorus gramineus TaxID=55184 RepID=A0AAV9ARB4_ACOGR|nr:hypothetical protein QJS04_geneDACA000544 [Acorus gramineus]
MTATTPQPQSEGITNDDLRPTTASERTFTGWDIASLWIGLVVCVPNYYLAGSLVDVGMSWWQGVLIVVLANTIQLFPLILTGGAGAKHGVPFPVLARASFGVRGAHIPAVLRSLVACGWCGVETWIGGQALSLLLYLPNPSFVADFACFIVCFAVQLFITWKGVHRIRTLERHAAPLLIALTLALFAWAYARAGGLGRMLSLPSRLTPREFRSLLLPSLTANIGSWSGLALNIPDFTRHARSQSDQALGQAGLPLFMGAFAFVGLAVTSATEPIFGRLISDPIELLAAVGGGFFVRLVAVSGLCLALITTNVAANFVASANTFISLAPKVFTFGRGALLTAAIGVAFQPWRILSSSDSFMYTWLVGYSAVLAPISGIVIVDYYVLRRRELNIDALYSNSKFGDYYYSKGYNLGAIAALVMGIAPVIPGFLHKTKVLRDCPEVFVGIYDNCWFFGFFTGGTLYWGLSLLFGGGGGAGAETGDSLVADPLLRRVDS